LQGHQDRVVADHVDLTRVEQAQQKIEIRLTVATRGGEGARRMAPRIQDIAAGQIKRQRQSEHLADLDFSHRSHHALGRQQIDPTEFVVFSEVTPIGARRAMGPAFHDDFP
jgi:hypothetical protein